MKRKNDNEDSDTESKKIKQDGENNGYDEDKGKEEKASQALKFLAYKDLPYEEQVCSVINYTSINKKLS